MNVFMNLINTVHLPNDKQQSSFCLEVTMQLSHCVGVLLLAVPYGLASFCGDSAIPFSFEALPDGQPVLGCSRPACFGWGAAGQPFSDKFSFYT